MGASLRQPDFQPELLAESWRGPHDPPGSDFRPDQTRQLYGYTPPPLEKERAISSASVETATRSAPALRIVTDTFQAPAPNARLALIEARRLVVMAREHREQYSRDELWPYALELEALVKELVKDLRPNSRLRNLLGNLFLGGDK